jgi:hypothetical protein
MLRGACCKQRLQCRRCNCYSPQQMPVASSCPATASRAMSHMWYPCSCVYTPTCVSCVLCTAVYNSFCGTAATCKSSQWVGLFGIYSLQQQSSLHVQAIQYVSQLAGTSSSALRNTPHELWHPVCCSPVAGCTAELFSTQYQDFGKTCMTLQASSTCFIVNICVLPSCG